MDLSWNLPLKRHLIIKPGINQAILKVHYETTGPAKRTSKLHYSIEYKFKYDAIVATNECKPKFEFVGGSCK